MDPFHIQCTSTCTLYLGSLSSLGSSTTLVAILALMVNNSSAISILGCLLHLWSIYTVRLPNVATTEYA